MSNPTNHAPRYPVLMLLPAMGVAARFYEPFARTLERACGTQRDPRVLIFECRPHAFEVLLLAESSERLDRLCAHDKV